MDITEEEVDKVLDKLSKSDSKDDLKYYYVKVKFSDGSGWGYKIYGDAGISLFLEQSSRSKDYFDLNKPNIIRLQKGIQDFGDRMKRLSDFNRYMKAARKLKEQGDVIGVKIKILEAYISVAETKSELREKAKPRLVVLKEIYDNDKEPAYNKKIENVAEKYNEKFRSFN